MSALKCSAGAPREQHRFLSDTGRLRLITYQLFICWIRQNKAFKANRSSKQHPREQAYRIGSFLKVSDPNEPGYSILLVSQCTTIIVRRNVACWGHCAYSLRHCPTGAGPSEKLRNPGVCRSHRPLSTLLTGPCAKKPFGPINQVSKNG